MSESFAELLEESFSSLNMESGTIIDGVVVEIRNDVVVVNAGLKSEGVIPIDQFKNERGETNINVGDIVEVALKLIYRTNHLIELSKIAKKTVAQNGTIEIAEKIDELAKS